MSVAWFRRLQWERGVRALLAIGSAMVVCHRLGVAPGAAALGAFDALLVDNGGPYRTRLVTMATTLVGGALAFVAGALVPREIGVIVVATAVVCFVVIFARVLSQPMASSGVLILVLYFAGLGGVSHTLAQAMVSAEMVLLGGAWAVVLSLVLWPVDPFRPARLGVAECYASLNQFPVDDGGTPPQTIRPLEMGHPDGSGRTAVFEWRRRHRIQMEGARAALAATAARAPARTIRARNLTVLLETADLLFARTVKMTELEELALSQSVRDSVALERLAAMAVWLRGSAAAIEEALRQRPADGGAAFGREGSQRMQFVTRRRTEFEGAGAASDSLLGHVVREETEALLEVETAFDAVRAIWTGSEVRAGATVVPPSLKPTGTGPGSSWDWGWVDSGWKDEVKANWTIESAMQRHALRMTIVGVVDVVVMDALNINHGFWLPMTSLILLQPYSAGTARKSLQRVGGTIAGGMLAAVMAAAIPSTAWMIPVITLLAGLTVASFAVDYAVYSFFLTPTFVLMSLPHPHDWRYAGVRIGTTLAGAAIALLAMRLLWAERAEVELAWLFRRGVAADAAYLRAMLRFWEAPADARTRAEREVLAPARRACGLASNDAEEAVDRVMQEPQVGRLPDRELRMRNEALTFATYLRRVTQSITTLAVVGRNTPRTHARLESLAARMDRLAAGEIESAPADAGRIALVDVAEEQMLRVERQVGILEKAAAVVRG